MGAVQRMGTAPTAIDPDLVSPTNITTQDYYIDQIGKPKVMALAETLTRINPAASMTGLASRYEDLSTDTRTGIWEQTTLAFAMTDQHATQKAINKDALISRVPMIAAMMGDGLRQMEVTATLPMAVQEGHGCFLCQVWSREKAYNNGFVNRAVIGSHIVSAALLNAQIAYIALGLLHHLAESSQPIARIGACFEASPCLLTQLDADFWSADPATYGVVHAGMELFTAKLFGLDSPKGWVCEACGTPGVK